MIHVALVVLLTMGLTLLGAVWLYVLVRILMVVFLDAASSDVTLARMGTRFLRRDKILYPGLFPTGSQIIGSELVEHAKLTKEDPEVPKE